MEIWRFLPLEVRNGFWNMALDEAVLKSVIEKKAPFTFRLYKWKPSCVSIGSNQSISDEVNLDIAKEKGIDVVRRITGGGAVFHDSVGEITYSIICPIKFLEDLRARSVLEQFELITQGISTGLTIFGLKSEQGVIHCPALFLEGKKFSGNAQVRERSHVLQHGTILLEIDPELMYSVLRAPNNVGKSRMVKSVYAKCVGIKDHLNNFEEEKFVQALKKGFEKTLRIDLKQGEFSKEELTLAETLVEQKFSSKSWLHKYD